MSADAADHRDERRLPRRDAALLAFAIAGPPAAWVIWLLSGYGVEEAACSPGVGPDFGQDADVTIIATLSIALAAVALAAGGAGYAVWRRNAGWARFLGFTATVASGLFAAIIVLTAFALPGLASCHH